MIYLDHAAATPVTPQALEAMLPYFLQNFFNPSAPYLPAKRVREAYETAKAQIARAIGAKSTDLVITSGATESINLAFTACLSYQDNTKPATILTLPTEHAAVLEAAKQYSHKFIKVNRHGLIDLADLRRQLSDEIVLVSISLANNELGTIQPLSEIAELIRAARQSRLQRGITTPLYLHTDASQAANLLNLSVARLGVDLLTLGAAKCGGPKGVGALYVARGVHLRPLSVGGGQEMGLRSGTENVPGVVGFATALSHAQAHVPGSLKHYQELSREFRRILTSALENLLQPSIISHISENVNSKIPASDKPASTPVKTEPSPSKIASIPSKNASFPTLEPLFLGDPKHQLANFIPISFPGLDAERLIYRLEADDILVSTGAACAANKGSKSHVLAAIGLSDPEIAGSLRISLGPTNDLAQIKHAAETITKAVIAEYQRGFSRGCGVTTSISARHPRRRDDGTRLKKNHAGIPREGNAIL